MVKLVWGEIQESDIVWIDDLSKLNEKYVLSKGNKPFIFARFAVVDETHDKLVRKFMSIKRAEARVERQHQYKKHAKCTIKIVEENILAKVPIDFSNVFGTEANSQRWIKNFHEASNPILKDLITIKSNINMVATISKISLDKNILTKTNNEEMRLTKLSLEDVNENRTELTLFNSPLADKFEEGQRIELIDASVNMRKQMHGDDYPEGINVPRWGSMKILTEEQYKEKIANSPKIEKPIYIPAFSLSENIPEQLPVVCEQKNCAGRGQDQQFFCFKCNMELCSVCKFEHMKGYSLFGLECDNEILYGNRVVNQL